MKCAAPLRASSLASLAPEQRRKWLASLTEAELTALEYDWRFWARDEQIPPPGDWRIWLLLAGRGFGKSRCGAEWVRAIAEGHKEPVRIALVSTTDKDVRGTMVEGDSGIFACSPPWFTPTWEPSVGGGRLTWPNGTQAFGFSAEVPRSLRGPQFNFAWVDEICAWRRIKETWDMLRMGLRLGRCPRTVVTTTPTPTALIKELVRDERQGGDGLPLVRVTRGSTYDNAANLAPEFLDELRAKYEGTRLGRQELYAEILSDKPGALWTLARIDALRVRDAPEMRRVVVAIDPPMTSGENADECGIVVAGLGVDGKGYVLDDLSERGLSPKQWAEKALGAYVRHQADRVVAEVNNGGELVETVLRQVDANVSYRAVRASHGKVTRAEPISALYEQARVHHHGCFKALEDQMADFTADWDRAKSGYSPDRVDAVVWALTELMLAPLAGAPRARSL